MVTRATVAVMVMAVLVAPGTAAQDTPVTVVFHAPGQDEAGVRLTTPIRLQFSADLDVSTIDGHVVLGYAVEDSQARGEPEPPPVAFETAYDPADRALTIRPAQPWQRFREVQLTLGNGIRSTDGRAAVPFRLSFMTGGS